MAENTINHIYFPRTEPPPEYTPEIISSFEDQLERIGTIGQDDGLPSDEVLATVRPGLENLGFDVEAGKKKNEKIKRPVFFGEGGDPTLKYEVDAYHEEWDCGLEVEAGRAWQGNAIYRDLIQAMVMVRVGVLALAVPNIYKWKSGSSPDFERTKSVAEALYGHSRVELPYGLLLIGY
ncbi:hypothetical protein GGP86_002737 [Salinibacter ruber]|uniref:hypothetical protein n=1 Tax=Salinibacter ruber TaxID=146919 RepID=UPI0021698EE1|nr:hypothetical protein [Salinibacter ruber]MCS3862948.1 hypothetical protein [Salinibacter ruber]